MKQGAVKGIVIDGSLQQGHNLLGRHTGAPVQAFPLKAEESKKNTSSYSTVVEQAVMTQDRPLLKQILLECESQMITTTVAQLSAGRVSGLLLLIEEFINADSKNTKQYCFWIRQIAVRHLGVLVANHDNLQTIARLRKLATKRIEEKLNLVELASRLRVGAEKVQSKQFVPRFCYAEGKQEGSKEESKGSEINFEGLLDQDDLMEQFDQ